MKGLLLKDFSLWMKQKKTFLMIVFMFGIFMLAGFLDTIFILGYVPLMFCVYVMSSISYDEFDNGFPFLMALPVSRKTYVKEKYIFGLFTGSIGCFIAGLMALIQKIRELGIKDFYDWIPEGMYTIGIVLLLVGIFDGIIIPIQLKYGGEKGRTILFGVIITILAVGYLAATYLKKLPDSVEKMLIAFSHSNPWMFLLGLFLFTMVVIVCSCQISICIMKKKEF